MRRTGIILLLIIISMIATATCSYATEIKYETPEGFTTTQVVHDGDGIVSESRMSNGDFGIDVTVYKRTKKTDRQIYRELNGREARKTKVDGIRAREGFTDIDHMIVFKDGNYIVELFASRSGSAFSGEEYSQLDEIAFQRFLKTIVVK